MTIEKINELILSFELKFNLLDKVKLIFATNKYDKESVSYFKSDIFNIEIGIKDYGNIEKITHKQYNHICNTVLHELIHARNFYLLSDEVKQKLDDNKMTLAHFAWKILDEYSAYIEANQQFQETAEELNGSINMIFIAFNHMTEGNLIGATDWEFYDAFYDYCTALIVRYIVDKDNLLSYDKGRNKRAIDSYMNDLNYSYSRMPLSYDQYESLGRRLIKDILAMIPRKKQKVFMQNTHIINLD